jgi:hypothetical protein
LDQVPVEQFNHRLMKERVLQTSMHIGLLGRCNVAEFRILLFVQICALSGIVLGPSLNLLNFIYPVEGKESDNHLREPNTSKQDSNESAMLRTLQEFGIEPFGFNAVESALCETSPGCTEVIYCFIKGQDLHNDE